MKSKNFYFFCAKAALFVLPVALLFFLFAVRIHDFQARYEPRTAILHIDDMTGYSYAIIGDSSFCSYFVNKEDDTIWKKFETFTGRKCFPGALDNISNGDFVNIARYIAYKIPAHSTVFIDIEMVRFITHDRFEKNHYDCQFADLFKKEKYLIYRYFNYLNQDYLVYAPKLMKGDKSDRDPSVHYDRTWNVDGDFAKDRYRNFISSSDKIASGENISFLKEIDSSLSRAKINAVFVLMPLNKTQIYAYSDKKQADLIYYKLKDLNEQIKIYFNEIGASYIDLFEAVPGACFADLIHTNVRGDEIIARSLADYALKAGK